ncbi:MAG: transposase [Bacteroidales bacterium]|jgi:REP element-mobilizing transposase RayT|nr:transposase [Bacteroidales bacterium]
MKSGTFTQLYEQLVFAVRFRECLLNHSRRVEVFSYVSGILKNLKHKSLIVNGYSDHIHIFYGRNPSVSTSDTISVIKKSSAWFINERKWFLGKFQWQDGYGGFSYSRSQIDDVYNYIARQEEHHKSIRFREEYINMLKIEQIEFDERFLFEFFEDIDSVNL